MAHRPTELEAKIENWQPIRPGAEHEIEVLRNVLLGNVGTSNQRGCLIRIISQNAPKKNYRSLLATKIIGGNVSLPVCNETYCEKRMPRKPRPRKKETKVDLANTAWAHLTGIGRPMRTNATIPVTARTTTPITMTDLHALIERPANTF